MATSTLMKAASGQVQLTSMGRCLSTTATTQRTKDPGEGRRPTMDSMAGSARLAALKKGTGYRSSFSGVVATIFGGTGMIGRGVANRLGQSGTQIIAPYRGDHYGYRRLKLCGDLGQVLFTPFDLKDEESIRRAVKYSSVVVNAIGSDWPTNNFSLEEINVNGPARMARICRESGVDRFIHFVPINARENPRILFSQNGSDFLRTKWIGEQAVLQEFPDATIIRASDIYGFGDSFIHHYFSWLRRNHTTIPLWKKGEETVKAPVHVMDIVTAVVNSLETPDAKGQIYEAYGPDMFLLAELIDWMYDVTAMSVKTNKRTDIRLSPIGIAKILAGEFYPLSRKFLGSVSIDKLERDSLSDEILGYPNLKSLGVEAKRVVDIMPSELNNYKLPGWAIPSDSEGVLENARDPIPLSRVEVRAVLDKSRTGLLDAIGLR